MLFTNLIFIFITSLIFSMYLKYENSGRFFCKIGAFIPLLFLFISYNMKIIYIHNMYIFVIDNMHIFVIHIELQLP
jgi:hypothetical protein